MGNIAFESILLIEDNPGDARLMREMLIDQRVAGSSLRLTCSMAQAEAYLASNPVDIIVLDLGLPDSSGVEAIRRTRVAAPQIPLLILTGTDDEALAIQSMKEGVQDYLIKGEIEPKGLLRALRYAVERKRMEIAFVAERNQAQATLDCIGEAVVCTDVRDGVTFLNVAAENLMGWTLAEALTLPLTKVLKTIELPESQVAELGALPADKQGSATPKYLTRTLVTRDGTQVPIELSTEAIYDTNRRTIGSVIVFRDVSIAQAMARQSRYAAEHDYLTGLPNRWLLNDRLHQAIAAARRRNTRIAVLFLDIDGFKYINDSLGHPIGDRLLQSVAKRLTAVVRQADTVSRQGGDEFIMLLPDLLQPADAALMATRVLRAVAESHSVDEHDLRVTTSIGISVYPDDSHDADTLIKNADTAMYQAKDKGRQNYQFFTPAMNARAVNRQFIEAGLRRAIDRNEFLLHYQPKICLLSGNIIGAEALVRWSHPTRGVIPPDDFIEIAEDSRLILPIGHWVLQEACRQTRAWLEEGLPPISIAVNVSAVEFESDEFFTRLVSTIRDSGLDPPTLELELTESVLMKRAEASAATLQSLRELGTKVSVDDFGTGYSSLSYLRKFPIDALKIDQSFVRQIDSGAEDAAIVTAVINMAHSLKLRVVAEGVETVAELTFLSSQGCDEAQGFLFSPPVAPAIFAGLLRSGLPFHAHGALRLLRARTPHGAASNDPVPISGKVHGY